MDIFGPWGRDRSQSPPCRFFSSEANTSIHGVGEDDTARAAFGDSLRLQNVTGRDPSKHKTFV